MQDIYVINHCVSRVLHQECNKCQVTFAGIIYQCGHARRKATDWMLHRTNNPILARYNYTEPNVELYHRNLSHYNYKVTTWHNLVRFRYRSMLFDCIYALLSYQPSAVARCLQLDSFN